MTMDWDTGSGREMQRETDVERERHGYGDRNLETQRDRDKQRIAERQTHRDLGKYRRDTQKCRVGDRDQGIQTPGQGQAGRDRYSNRAFHGGQWRRRGLQRCIQGCGLGVSKGRGPGACRGGGEEMGVAWMRRVPTTPDCCGRGGGRSPGKRWRWGKERLYRNEPLPIRFLRPGLGSETGGEGTPAQFVV